MVCGDGEKGECEVKVVRPVRKESNWSREIGKKRRGIFCQKQNMCECFRPIEFRFDVPNYNVNEPLVNVDMPSGLRRWPWYVVTERKESVK
jgi:hypothetical protein